MSSNNHGPGYSSPLDAFKNGPHERWLYVTCVKPDESCPDYLATVDVDENSNTYGHHRKESRVSTNQKRLAL